MLEIEKKSKIKEINACIKSGRSVFLTVGGAVRTHQQHQSLSAFKVVCYNGKGSDFFKISDFINNPSGYEKPFRLLIKSNLLVSWDEITFIDNEYWRFGKNWELQDYSPSAVAKRKVLAAIKELKSGEKLIETELS